MRRSRAFVALWVAVGAVLAAAVAVPALLLTGASSDAGAGLPGVKAATPATTVAPGIAPALPAHGAYTGAYVQPTDYSQHGRIAALRAFQGQLGRRLDIVHQYLRWDAPFPTPSERAMMRAPRPATVRTCTESGRSVAGSIDTRAGCLPLPGATITVARFSLHESAETRAA